MRSMKILNTQDVEIEMVVKAEVKLECTLDLGLDLRLASVAANDCEAPYASNTRIELKPCPPSSLRKDSTFQQERLSCRSS